MWAAVIAVLVSAQLALAAPVNDGRIKPTEHEPTYVNSPMGRGTLDLFFTCIITLSLCVWTAVHPDIIARSTYMDRLRYKALYVVLGLFSPEIVLSEAFNQWRKARDLQARVHRVTAETILKNAVDKAAPIGGFPVPNSNNASDNGDRPLPPSDNVDARVKKTYLALQKAITEASGESTTSDDFWLHRALRKAAITIWNMVDDVIGDMKHNDSENAVNREETTRPRVTPRLARRQAREEEQKANDGVRRTLKRLAALDKATKNYLSAKRISKAKRASWLRGLGRWVIECLPFISPSEEETPTFTMEIAFFIVMGGLTFSPIDHLKYRAYERTLSARGLMALVKTGVVDPMRLLDLKVDIQDKGKSDFLAKVLVCAQASWMMINCLLRKAAGLPITVIELNVIVHVLSMIAIYACWWKKPHDAGMPIAINVFLDNQSVCSLLYLQSKDPKTILRKPETLTSGTDEKSSTAIAAQALASEDPIMPVNSKQSPGRTTSAAGAPAKHWPENGAEPSDKGKKVKIGKKEKQPTEDEYLLIKEDADKARNLPCCAKIGEIEDITTLPGRFKFRSLVVVLIPLCLIYGGIHASLWNAYFPTPIERWLWRISACIVGVPGLGSAAIWGVKYIFKDRKDLGRNPAHNRIKHTIKNIFSGTSYRSWFKKAFTTIFIVIIMVTIVVFLFALCIALAAVPLGAMGGVIYGGILGNRKIMKLAVKWRVMCYFEFLCSIALGVLISGAGFVMAVAGGIQLSAYVFKRYKKEFGVVAEVPLTVLLAVAAVSVIVYCGARVFILVETFICLRSLPVGAYKTVRWDEFWPHL